MTPDEFTRLIKSSKPEAFAVRVASLTDKERRSLSKTAADLLTGCRKKERGNWGMVSKDGAMARLAVLAVSPWSKAQQVRCRDLRFAGGWRDSSRGSPLGAAVQILIDRKPDWADKWLERQLGGDSWEMDWPAVQRLVSSGTCQRPTDNDGYIGILAGQVALVDFDSDPQLLEQDVWRLFEVDTWAFGDVPDLKSIDRQAWAASIEDKPGEIWRGAWPRILYHFAASGRIDRGRLIDATLQALWRDFKAPAKAGLVKFHDLLDPTPEERAERQTAYIELLRNTHGPSVNLALQTIESLHKRGRADVPAILAQLPDIFHLDAKTQPKKAVRLIEKLVGKDAARAAEAVPVLVTAFSHESPDVHEAAVKLLEKWKGRFENLPLNELSGAYELVNPTLQGRFAELIGKSPAGESLAPDAADADADVDERQADLLEAIRSLPVELARRCGLADAESRLATLTLPAPFPPDPAFPVLSGVEPIEPIGSLDELIDELAHAMEIVESPEQIERILDGVVRLGSEDLEPCSGRLAGIRRQLEDATRAPERGLVHQVNPVPGIRRLLRTWLGVTKRRGEGGSSVFDSRVEQLLSGFEARCGELVRRFSGNQFGPMVSLPTHRGGWIDSREFVRRLRELSERDVAPGKMDLIHGLLRLAPDFREEALADAADLGDPWGRCLRYALGGDERPEKADAGAEAAWLAAGRARKPLGRLEELSSLDIDPNWPDGVTPAEFVIHSEVAPPDPQDAWRPNQAPASYVSVEPEPNVTKMSRLLSAAKLTRSRDPGFIRPTVCLAVCSDGTMRYWGVPEWISEFLSTIWPARPDACCAMACNQLLLRIDQTGSTFEPNWRLLRPLLQPDRGWTRLACTALWFGLLGRDENARGLGLDALIEGIQDGRAHPDPLAEALCGIQRGGWMKLNRVAGGLQEAARTGPLAELVVAEVLDRLIAGWDGLPRDAHHLLALQLEVLSKLRRTPSPATKDVLSGAKGSGKSAKLARQICGLEAGHRSEQRAAVLQGLEGRLIRAQRVARLK